MRKRKLPEPLQTLTETQRQTIQQWLLLDGLTFAAARERLAKPAPEGFGLSVNRGVLERFFRLCNAKHIYEQHLKLALTAQTFLDVHNGDPVPFGAAGLVYIQKTAFKLVQQEENHTPSKLRGFQNIFDYENRHNLNQARLQIARERLDLAKRRDTRDQVRLDLQLHNGRRRREESHSSSDSPISGENCTPVPEPSDFELRVSDYLKKYPQYTREEIVEYLSLTADQRRDRFFGGFGIYGDELTLHKARIDRDLCESREAHPEEEMKLVFERELPTLEEARRLETEARAALELEPLDYPVDEDLRAKLGLPIKNYHDDDCLCNKCASIKGRRRGDESHISSEDTRTPAPSTKSSSRREEAHLSPSVSPISGANRTPEPSSHSPNPSENSLSSVASAKEDVLNPPPLSPLQLAVSEYIRLRIEEYQTKTVHLSLFRTTLEYCPCGAQLPCPDHAPKEKPFRKLFWHINPEDPDFAQILIAHGLPWRDPNHDPVAEKKAAELKARVQHYTQLRYEEYRAKGTAIFNYVTTYTHCPCGRGLPCPDHAPAHKPFPAQFWELSTLEAGYTEIMLRHGLPYTRPQDQPQQGAA